MIRSHHHKAKIDLPPGAGDALISKVESVFLLLLLQEWILSIRGHGGGKGGEFCPEAPISYLVTNKHSGTLIY